MIKQLPNVTMTDDKFIQSRKDKTQTEQLLLDIVCLNWVNFEICDWLAKKLLNISV